MTDNDALVRKLEAAILGADSADHLRDKGLWDTARLVETAAEILAALRSTPQAKSLDLPAQDEVEVVAVAVAQSTPQPGAVVNQCLAELGDAEPLVVSKEDDGWAVRTLSAWRLLHRAADDALPDEIARLRGALRDASVSLCWAARQMKGNCNGGAVDAVNLAAGNASSAAALTGRQG